MKLTLLQYKTLRPWLWRWHRRAGLAALIVVVLVTVTGLMLNHTSELSLGKTAVSNERLLGYYGIQTPKLSSFAVNDVWFSGDDKSQLYFNEQLIGTCQQSLIAAVAHQGYYWLACQQQVIMLSPQGEVIDSLSAVYGLPVPIVKFGLCEQQLCLATAQRSFVMDAEQFIFTPVDAIQPLVNAEANLPLTIEQAIIRAYRGQGLSWERVLLDLHSGRLFGNAGVWIVDAAALLLLFLSLSGFVLWYQQYSKKKVR
ncbi:PepSY-associated TM helix domain-containing protein [Dasania sp. GY-MA-18]|uniref:PepSY-associated TM helix domain-containing protein n=1 Tax=Dasania phycosphaerae TaxID=2950436 RepID=A0A9J6RHE1_9GAMM|nr:MULTISPECIES: PepSY-associated TM helix domain-containing protein [Dasania]MCR8921325.1 PepSY-associated TM helix domain-containing protein [Dasania sp. GY-MA-18]MCZ0863753.1 PepSY-associated TM helix domain-containing protein [Dasania phycosphaerae]MCZ0867481.1 PepSY-associated TM helix domain-containing protein [Dasania phycosphaerae]